MIEIAIMGHGVVGSGVAGIITTHKKKLFASIGEEIHIKHILDLREFPDSPLADRFTKDFEDIINDVEVRVVAEVMGGINPAYDYTKRLLKAGKSVVTSNKELVAAKGAELLQIAKENNANFLFEASVGGGIPIIRPLSQCLVANEVKEIAGILNGTTNFILTKMFDEGMDFDSALKLAQDLGFAERNPAADVEGHDACRKICILASLAFGKHVYPDNIHTEGITEITLADVKYAASMDSVIKLIGDVKLLDGGKMDIFVAPMLISKKSQLANIDNEFNGIMVRGDCTGDVVFYGKGAGSMPTASAVVADIVDCCKHLKARKYLFWADSTNDNIISYNESKTAVYLRLSTTDRETALAKVKEFFGDVQVLSIENEAENELAVITPVLSVEQITTALSELEKDGITALSNIRIGDL
ncbi:MAG: homoserine dehydrogenase [Ruminococcus sp.]|nr:homoserine dehydrogenase [Ruminococcus sp.]